MSSETINPVAQAADAAAPLQTETKTPLTSAPPPWHSVATVGAMVAMFVYWLPSWDDIDQAAQMRNFTRVLFPHLVDLQTVIYIRLLMALSIWSMSFYLVFIYQGWEQMTSYLPSSKLISVPNQLSGYKTMMPFTSLSWNLLGLAYAFNTYIAYQGAQGKPVPQWTLRAAVVLWEIAAPFTLLVAAVIRYAIWPAVLRATGKTEALKSFRNVMMHNVNVLYALTETALLGGLGVHWNHFAFAPLVGCAYVVLSWCMVWRWNDRKHGPQFIYFFFDTTLPGYTTTVALLVLLAVLAAFFGIFCVCDEILSYLGNHVGTHAAFVALVCSAVMRFRD